MDEIKAILSSHVDQVGELFESFSAQLRDQLLHNGKLFDPIRAFIHAVDWTEPWLIGLISFHVILAGVVILTGRHTDIQMVLFFAILAAIYFAENLNQHLSSRWSSFASQNYFDRKGLFISSLWSGPLLLIANIILVNTLIQLVKLIIKWKKTELRHRAKAALKKTE